MHNKEILWRPVSTDSAFNCPEEVYLKEKEIQVIQVSHAVITSV